MIKMDLSTKQVFLSGLFAWLLTIAVGVISGAKLLENHDVRIEATEIKTERHFELLMEQQKQINKNQRDAALTADAIVKLSESQDKLVELFRETRDSSIRTETTLEIIKSEVKNK